MADVPASVLKVQDIPNWGDRLVGRHISIYLQEIS